MHISVEISNKKPRAHLRNRTGASGSLVEICSNTGTLKTVLAVLLLKKVTLDFLKAIPKPVVNESNP